MATYPRTAPPHSQTLMMGDTPATRTAEEHLGGRGEPMAPDGGARGQRPFSFAPLTPVPVEIRSLILYLLALVVAVLPLPGPALANDVIGIAAVIDGDTLEVRGQRIRLHGVVAPKDGLACRTGGGEHRCRRLAALVLARKVARRPVSCSERETNRDGGIIAVCRLDDEELGAWLVREGWALADRKHPHAYLAEEEVARDTHRGIWLRSVRHHADSVRHHALIVAP